LAAVLETPNVKLASEILAAKTGDLLTLKVLLTLIETASPSTGTPLDQFDAFDQTVEADPVHSVLFASLCR
jgi:hypothetical protein